MLKFYGGRQRKKEIFLDALVAFLVVKEIFLKVFDDFSGDFWIKRDG